MPVLAWRKTNTEKTLRQLSLLLPDISNQARDTHFTGTVSMFLVSAKFPSTIFYVTLSFISGIHFQRAFRTLILNHHVFLYASHKCNLKMALKYNNIKLTSTYPL